MPGLDPGFAALPYRALGDAALQRARELGATHADFRFERVRWQDIRVRDDALQGTADDQDLGFAVRVIHGGAWGFASGVHLTADEAVRVAEAAIEVAKVSSALTTVPVEIADEPVVRRRDLGVVIRAGPVRGLGARQGGRAPRLDRPAARTSGRPARDRRGAPGPREQVLRGSRRHPHHPAARAPAPDVHRDGRPTTQRGHLRRHGLDRAAGRPRLGVRRRQLRATVRGTGPPSWPRCPTSSPRSSPHPRVQAGVYDLVVHPSNLWLTIHESIGHATELDRALGYEANYAGTSFATIDKLGTLQYGSPVMHITGDRTVEHGLATIGYDDEGVATQSWDIVKDGVLVGYQLDRPMAHLHPELNPVRRAAAAPTAAPMPTPPATSRSSGWPTSRCSPRPTTSRPTT